MEKSQMKENIFFKHTVKLAYNKQTKWDGQNVFRVTRACSSQEINNQK
jgi:hypothetical protein